MIVSWSIIRICKSRVLETVGIDEQCSPTCAPAQKVVAGIADDQPQIVSASEVNSCLYVFVGLGKNDIDSVVSKRASRAAITCRSAGVVGIIGPQSCCRLVGSVSA